MKFCISKTAYVIWDGTNLTEVLDFLAPVLYEGTVVTATAVGDQLHYTDVMRDTHVLAPGTILMNYGAPTIVSPEDFAFAYTPITP